MVIVKIISYALVILIMIFLLILPILLYLLLKYSTVIKRLIKNPQTISAAIVNPIIKWLNQINIIKKFKKILTTIVKSSTKWIVKPNINWLKSLFLSLFIHVVAMLISVKLSSKELRELFVSFNFMLSTFDILFIEILILWAFIRSLGRTWKEMTKKEKINSIFSYLTFILFLAGISFGLIQLSDNSDVFDDTLGLNILSIGTLLYGLFSSSIKNVFMQAKISDVTKTRKRYHLKLKKHESKNMKLKEYTSKKILLFFQSIGFATGITFLSFEFMIKRDYLSDLLKIFINIQSKEFIDTFAKYFSEIVIFYLIVTLLMALSQYLANKVVDNQ